MLQWKRGWLVFFGGGGAGGLSSRTHHQISFFLLGLLQIPKYPGSDHFDLPGNIPKQRLSERQRRRRRRRTGCKLLKGAIDSIFLPCHERSMQKEQEIWEAESSYKNIIDPDHRTKLLASGRPFHPGLWKKWFTFYSEARQGDAVRALRFGHQIICSKSSSYLCHLQDICAKRHPASLWTKLFQAS